MPLRSSTLQRSGSSSVVEDEYQGRLNQAEKSRLLWGVNDSDHQSQDSNKTSTRRGQGRTEKVSPGSTPRDPWKHLENPDLRRDLNEGDLTVNQVWLQKLNVVEIPDRKPDWARNMNRRKSQPALLRPLSREGEGGSKDNTSKKPQVESRIREFTEEKEDELKLPRGSYAVRSSAVTHARFQKPLEESALQLKGVVWLLLDPAAGKVRLYPRRVATRLEAAHKKRRSNVPLSDLGNEFEDIIVDFGNSLEGGKPVQRARLGEECDVRRVQLVGGEAVVQVSCDADGKWQIVSVGAKNTEVADGTEERRVRAQYTQLAEEPESTNARYTLDHRSYFAGFLPSEVNGD